MNLLQSLEEKLAPLLGELEELCAEGEVALRARNWDGLTTALQGQRRVRQAMVNEFADANCGLDAVSPYVAERLRGIFVFRGEQLRRLSAYRDDVSKQLRHARKWKDIVRSARAGIGPAPSLISRTQ